MIIPPPIRTRSPRRETVLDQSVYVYPDLQRQADFRLTPRENPQKWQNHVHYSYGPMLLSPGQWTIQSQLEISNDNLHMKGVGYWTSLAIGGQNTTGTLLISGDNVIIENIRFTRETVLPTRERSGRSGTATSLVTGGNYIDVRGSNVTIRNCWIDCTNGAVGVYARIADKLTIENCIVDGGSGDMFYLLDCDDAIIENNRMNQPGGYSGNVINLDSTGTGAADTRCNFAIVAGNHVGASGVIRYNNATGSHQVAANNANATLTTY
jgi:hypothetical protein